MLPPPRLGPPRPGGALVEGRYEDTGTALADVPGLTRVGRGGWHGGASLSPLFRGDDRSGDGGRTSGRDSRALARGRGHRAGTGSPVLSGAGVFVGALAVSRGTWP